MNAIGGYFELELNKQEEYHKDAICLNSGRNAFEYILKAKKYQKIYVPYFICDVMLEPIHRLGLKASFYHIDKNFEAILNVNSLDENEVFLYINYFGLKDKYIDKITSKYGKVIIDNSQAFYSKPVNGVDTFYSARKFFGVPDGAYLYTNTQLNESLAEDKSFARMEHLLRRLDNGAEDGYSYFIQNDKALSNQPIKTMSVLSRKILQNIDYAKALKIRKANYAYLNNKLSGRNEFGNILDNTAVPMVFPFYSTDIDLRRKFINQRIYTAQYWPNVLGTMDIDSVEYNYANYIIHLPIDQRINQEHLDKMIKIINNDKR